MNASMLEAKNNKHLFLSFDVINRIFMKLSDQRNKLASLELAIELGSIVEEAAEFLVRLARSPWVESTGVVSRDDRSDWFCRLPASPSPSHFAAFARLISSS